MGVAGLALGVALPATAVFLLCIVLEWLRPRIDAPHLSDQAFLSLQYLALRVVPSIAVFSISLHGIYPETWRLQLADMPVWSQAVIVLLVLDFKDYWLHRGQHSFGWWWH
jgi:sterol desaturase/sphingolipid hydroxylase (fatty acid hydroxylase superfamily)